MKRIFNKIGKGYSKLRQTKVKIIIIAILAIVMLIDFNPFFLKAGRETLVYTFENGVQIPYAFDNNHNSYSYYSISKMGGHIAYCMDYDIKNPPNGTGLQYLRNVKSTKIVAVLMNGYPAKSAAQLGVSNNQEAYLATQMAVWSAANGTADTKGLNFDINKLQANLKYSAQNKELFENAKKAANKILQSEYPSGRFAVDSSSAKINYDYNDKQIRMGPYKPVIEGFSALTKVNVTLEGQPAGTLLVDKNGNQKSTFAKNEEMYVLVNKTEAASGLKIVATGTANKYVGVVYGRESWQNFVFLDTEQIDVKASATVYWEESKGSIKILKTDQDKNPIQGAEFTVSDSTGKQINSGKTDANGNLQFDKLQIGNYTITETSVPDGYIVQKSTYSVTVKRKEITTVNVQNTKVKGVLQITKIEKNSKAPIAGAVFEIYNKDGKAVTKLTTDANGIATSPELSKGTYTYKEISVPDGYIMDTQVREFSITEKNDVIRETITNEKIVGSLEIIKIGDDGERPLEGAEFEVYNSAGKVIATLITDKDGKASINDLGKGTYTYKEIKSPEGYELDTKEYSFKIETLKQVVTANINNKKIYGKLKIEKVDENNNVISGVKFQVLDLENKEIATIETNENGIATCENLPVGKYKYKEIDTPYLYVLDEKEYEFEITSEQREVNVKVVNERAKGILKIIKIDKDSKVAIANAKFNIIDKTNNDIVDAVVTDENGVARTKALPTGEYYYQEVEVPDEYIIDTNTYEVKIKKNNQMVEEKVSNEHKKLPVTGGFLSTDVTIVLIVASTSVIAYVIYKIIKSRKDNPNHPDDDFYIPQDPEKDNNCIVNENIENTKVKSNDETNFENNNEILNNNNSQNTIAFDEINENTSKDSVTEENNNINIEKPEQNNVQDNIENDESIIIDNSNDSQSKKENIINDNLENEFKNLDDLEDEMLNLTPKHNNDIENNDN